jgi:hypothetical protein
MPALIIMDKNNNCKIVLENCALNDVNIERNNLMGLIKIKEEELISLTDNIISLVCADNHAKLPKILKAKLSHTLLADATFKFWMSSEKDTIKIKIKIASIQALRSHQHQQV